MNTQSGKPSQNVLWLAGTPADDVNFKSALKRASSDELREAAGLRVRASGKTAYESIRAELHRRAKANHDWRREPDFLTALALGREKRPASGVPREAAADAPAALATAVIPVRDVFPRGTPKEEQPPVRHAERTVPAAAPAPVVAPAEPPPAAAERVMADSTNGRPLAPVPSWRPSISRLSSWLTLPD
jgi:hypothetical protein